MISYAEQTKGLLAVATCDRAIFDCLTPFERTELGAFWEKWRRSHPNAPTADAACACLATLISAGLHAEKRV